MEYLDYNYEKNGMHYKHTVTEAPPCDAFSMHTHNMHELLFFISGDATHIIEDRKYKLKKGDLIIIRPQKYHYIQIDSCAKYERFDILFDPEIHGISALNKISGDIEVINLSPDSPGRDIFKRLDMYYSKLNVDDFSQILHLLLNELFYFISIDGKNAERTEFSVISPTLSDALKYINENIFTLKSISEVAGKLFISPTYLFKLFKTELKQTPKKYICAKRLLAAQTYISNGDMPSTVYEKCGFNDYTSFYRSYLNFFGYPPSKTTK